MGDNSLEIEEGKYILILTKGTFSQNELIRHD